MPEPVMAALQAVMGHLVESLLHDVRNPLNALAINLEVLNEKLKDESGTVLKSSEKNIRAMREQVFRVDTVLRMFAEFLAPRPGGSPEHALSHLVERALEVLSHEARKGGVKLRSHLQPNVMVWCSDGAALRFLTLQSILRALLRAGAGAEVCVDLERKEGRAVLTVSDPAGDRPDPYPQIRPALEALAGAHGVEAAFSAGQCRLAFPLA
jgi:signal transduction histidine kinase